MGKRWQLFVCLTQAREGGGIDGERGREREMGKREEGVERERESGEAERKGMQKERGGNE